MTGIRTLQAAVATTTLAAAGLLGATTSSASRHTLAVRRRNGRSADKSRPLPIGEVTFLMTDVAGSTRMWEERPDIAGGILERHEVLIRTIVHKRGGTLMRSKGEGDSTFSVFANACGAVIAAVEIQRALQREPWPDGMDLRVRAASYTDEVELRQGGYRGPAPNRCARLRAAAHPGQTVCSQSTEARLSSLPAEIIRIDLGLYRLRDVTYPERVFQLGHRELRADFPPLRTPAADGPLPKDRRTGSVGAPLWHPLPSLIPIADPTARGVRDVSRPPPGSSSEQRLSARERSHHDRPVQLARGAERD
jgi:class 3 adenylate cyclase